MLRFGARVSPSYYYAYQKCVTRWCALATGFILCLLVLPSSAEQVTLAWDASPSARVEGYRLYYGVNSQTYTSSIDAGAQTTYTVDGLIAGQTYYFAVTAYDHSRAIESVFSNELRVTLPGGVGGIPVASFSASPRSGAPPLGVTFTDTSTGSVAAWVWDFGDGSTSLLRHPVHTYATVGTYTVRLTAIGPGGSHTTTQAAYISVGVPPPVASFSATPRSGPRPLTTTFTNTSTGPVSAWGWELGDGTQSTQQHPVHTYATPGTYTVRLTATGPGGSHTTTQAAYITVAPAVFEVGEIDVDSLWKRVALHQEFVDPIVVAMPLSLHDPTMAVVRLRNIGPSGFDIRIQEWETPDGPHAPESVGYMVMERGQHTLGSGIKVEAGRLTANQTIRFTSVPFRQSFVVPPVLLAAVTSSTGADFLTTRVRDITPSGFQIRLQERAYNWRPHAVETLDYIAWEPSSGTLNGYTFEVGTAPQQVTNQAYALTFTAPFPSAPILLAGMQTMSSEIPATLRWEDKDHTGVALQLQEGRAALTTIPPAAEGVGYMVFTVQ